VKLFSKVLAVTILALGALGALGVFGICWYASGKVIHPGVDPPPSNPPPLRLEKVHFFSSDGLRLAGWFLPGTNRGTVILAHGRGSGHQHMLLDAKYLNEGGFSVFLFDFRYRGESEGDAQTLGAKESRDVISALEYLGTRSDVDLDRIGVQGNSMGAAAAIMAAAARTQIRGVVAESSFTSVNGVLDHTFPREIGLPSFPFAPITKWICEFRTGVDFDRVAPIEVIGTIGPRPVFLIDDLDDDLFPRESSEALYQAASAPKTLWQIPGCAHGQGRECEPEEYPKRVLDFWRAALVGGR